MVKAQSAAGKSFTTQQVLSLFPGEVVYHISSMSAKAIIYEEDGFQHKMIFLAEGEALVKHGDEKNDVAEMLRVMISALSR